jgi:hypothetical protein
MSGQFRIIGSGGKDVLDDAAVRSAASLPAIW